MPNQTWQSDFTHYPLTDTETFPKGIEIITWLDDCTRYALHLSAHPAITTTIVKATFRKAAAQHGIPASTLTDNGMVADDLEAVLHPKPLHLLQQRSIDHAVTGQLRVTTKALIDTQRPGAFEPTIVA
ncbi:MAG: transposase family protein [Nocardioides sp.]|nr:transposase family protein [Nocardioides sp.]